MAAPATWSAKAFRTLLWLYPGEFHDEYGRELALVFADRWRAARTPWQRVQVALEAVRGVLAEAPLEHARVLLGDLRHAVRALRQVPLMVATVVVTLALALGANATMFSIVERFLLRPIPGVSEPERVVRVYGRGTWTALTRSWPDYLDLRDGTHTLAGVAAFRADRTVAIHSGSARKLRVERVTPSYFALLGLAPRWGRFFSGDEGTGDGHPVAVLSHAFWQREWAGNPNALGRTLRLGERVHTVIGIAPPEFSGVDPEPAAVWVPLGEPRRDRGNYGAVQVIARLRAGVPLENADQDVNAANRRGYVADGLRPDADVMRLGALALTQGPAAPKEIRVSLWLAAVAGLVLLIGGANVMQVLLARALARQRENGVRLALGARRTRLLRESWTECLLLAGLGGLAALAVVWVASPVAQRLLLPAGVDAAPPLGGGILLVTAALVLVVGLVCGTVPAWQALQSDLVTALKTGAREGPQRPSRLRSTLVMGQVALTVVLLVGTGLFVRSLERVRALEPGFALDRLMVVHLDARPARLSGEQGQVLLARLAERARALPGVTAAGLSHTVPFESSWRTRFHVPGRDPERWGEEGGGRFNRLSAFVAPEAVDALGLRVVAGRGLRATDRAGAQPVALVNEQFAREVWPGQSAPGQCLRLMRPDAPCTEVVGVVNDTRVESLFDAPPAQYYLPLAQPRREEQATALLVRTAGEPDAIVATLQRELQALAPGEAIVEARPLAATIEPVMRPWRLGAGVFAAFGSLALAIAAVGLFGLLSHAVARRTHEFGVRQALGARPFEIARLVTASMLRTVLPGVALGLAGALAGSRWVASLLYGITAADPASYVAAACVSVAVALAATAVPVRRALRLDPMASLRQE